MWTVADVSINRDIPIGNILKSKIVPLHAMKMNGNMEV